MPMNESSDHLKFNLINNLSKDKLVLIGPTNAGKTTLHKYLKLAQPVLGDARRTTGLDDPQEPISGDIIRKNNLQLTTIDIGGQKIYQTILWKLGIDKGSGIILVIDATLKPDDSEFSTSKNAINFALDLLSDYDPLPIGILLNKQDLVSLSPMKQDQAVKHYGLDTQLLSHHNIKIFHGSAKWGHFYPPDLLPGTIYNHQNGIQDLIQHFITHFT